MDEPIKLLFGVLILFLAVPIGNFLKGRTLDEQKDGRVYFRIITVTMLVTGTIGLVAEIDWLMFASFFIAIITSRSLK